MINRTSLLNPVVIQKIKQATKNCLNGYNVDHVTNKKGDAFLAVRIREGRAQVMDKHGNDLTAVVSQVI